MVERRRHEPTKISADQLSDCVCEEQAVSKRVRLAVRWVRQELVITDPSRELACLIFDCPAMLLRLELGRQSRLDKQSEKQAATSE
jgi:hypothetical protein